MKNNILKPTFFFAILKSLPVLSVSAILIFFSFEIQNYSQYFILGSIAPIFIFAYNVLLITSRKYIIEDEQLIFKRGLFTLTEDFLELYRVKDYKVVRSFPFRLIGVMEIVLETSDKTHPIFKISGVSEKNIAPDIRALVETNRRARGVREFD